jgi:predicted amidohydrolase
VRARALSALAVTALVCACAADKTPAPVPDLDLVSIGEDRGEGNVLALELYADPAVYATEERLRARVDEMLLAAREEGWLGPRTIVALPEYAGAWLVAVDEDAAVHSAQTTGDAMLPLVLSDLGGFLSAQGASPAEDADRYAVFAMKAERVADAYQRVFSSLAAQHAVTLVAGSVLLPGPEVVDGVITPTTGAGLQNVSFVFGPDGALLGGPVRKAFPTKDEQGFLEAADPAQLEVIDTPAGRLGVLVCADAWYPDAVGAIAAQSPDVVVVPQYVTGEGLWTAPWGGYSGHAAPDDVKPEDVGVLTEAEAWERYAMDRLVATGADTVAIVPLRGELWDLGTDGQALVAAQGERVATAHENTPKVVTVWR